MLADFSRPVPVTDPELPVAPMLRKARAIRKPVKSFYHSMNYFQVISRCFSAWHQSVMEQNIQEFCFLDDGIRIVCPPLSRHSGSLKSVSLVKTR